MCQRRSAGRTRRAPAPASSACSVRHASTPASGDRVLPDPAAEPAVSAWDGSSRSDAESGACVVRRRRPSEHPMSAHVDLIRRCAVFTVRRAWPSSRWLGEDTRRPDGRGSLPLGRPRAAAGASARAVPSRGAAHERCYCDLQLPYSRPRRCLLVMMLDELEHALDGLALDERGHADRCCVLLGVRLVTPAPGPVPRPSEEGRRR